MNPPSTFQNPSLPLEPKENICLIPLGFYIKNRTIPKGLYNQSPRTTQSHDQATIRIAVNASLSRLAPHGRERAFPAPPTQKKGPKP